MPAIAELLSKVFARTDREVLNDVVTRADKLSPAEIQGHVDTANKAGKVDLAYLLGSLKYAKEAWDNMAFWTNKAPSAKAGEVLLDKRALPGNWQAYDRFGSAEGPKSAMRKPDGKISQQELLRGIVNDRAAQLGIKPVRFSTPTFGTKI